MSPGPDDRGDDRPEDIGRSTRTMAIGTIASRGTGFLRTAVLASVLGVEGVAAFQAFVVISAAAAATAFRRRRRRRCCYRSRRRRCRCCF